MPEEQNELVVRNNAPVVAGFSRYSIRMSSPMEFLGIAARHWRLMVFAFLATLAGAIAAAILLPNHYTAHLKILVRHERVDQVITPAADAARTFSPEGVTDEEIDSEIELIHSQDLLEKLVLDYGLAKTKPHFWTATLEQWQPTSNAIKVSKAVQRLKSDLVVERIKKSSFIDVSYTSNDPEMAAKVLNGLGAYYLTKHMDVRRPAGEYQFFATQTDLYGKKLKSAEAQLAEFNKDQEAVAADVDRNMVLQKVTDLEFYLKQTRATVSATRQRISALEAQLASTPPRVNTTIKKADNTALLADLKKTLSELELKRTELLTKYEPTYVEVQQLDAQIKQTRAVIEREMKAPAEENNSDQNGTYTWLSGELAKARADLPTLVANADATERAVSVYRSKIGRLDQKGLMQQDLLRAVKSEEENYLLYHKKQEEARISDQMDFSRISNVVIADSATVPALPAASHLLLALLGIPLGLLVSVGAAFVSDYLDPSFRNADEVWDVLQLQVLAALPGDEGRTVQRPLLLNG